MKKDVLIVGQGVAGTVLAFELIARGLDVHIVDDNHATASSLVGIAVINPVTGRRHAKSWNIDELLPIAKDTYTHIGEVLSREYLSDATMYQILSDPRVEEIWMLRAGDPEFQKYLDDQIFDLTRAGLHQIRGAQIRQALHLRISALLDDAANWFTVQGVLTQKTFELQDLQISTEGIAYDGNNYNHVIFCEGHRVVLNALFKNLEIYPMKGEYLLCHIPNLDLPYHLKSSISIIPLAEKDLYWCGATYDRYNNDPKPTQAGREYLTNHLQQVISIPYSVVHHGVGIRATTRDRRPYVGTHPDHPRVHLIAGLGTKGASLAPYCAQRMTAYLTEGKEIPEEIHIGRHTE